MILVLRQGIAVFKKNLKLHLHNKKKLLSQFIFPLVICAIYHFYKTQEGQLNPIYIIMSFLLTIYLGLINSSSVREIITLFINQRQQDFRQYQYVMGLHKKIHTLSNMFYMLVYTSVFLFPFYVMINLYGFKLVYIFNFASFVISSSFLTIALTSFFNEHKVATEIIGLLFSLGSFLPFLYEANTYDFKHYLAILMPNSSFTLAIMANNDTDRFTISFASLLMWKFYLLIFYAVQFKDDLFEFLQNCLTKCKRVIKKYRNRDEMLMNDIQVQAASVLTYSQAQDDNLENGRPTLELIGVRKEFGKVVAVENISLKLYKSKILGLLGRNGAGKTTLVDMITNVAKPTKGQIKFYISDDNKEITKGICYQHEILYEDLSVIDHLRFYCEIKNVDDPEKEIYKIVDKVGIRDQLQKKTKQLSGGNKRKLSFCIALLNSPNLLIFDEPTSGLDPSGRRHIWDVLQKLRSLQTTIILTTHHLDEADHLSDYICVIKKGRKIEQGSPAQIKQKHGNGYYLTIYYNSQSGIPFDVNLCNKIIHETLLQYKINDQNAEYLKYFITKANNYQNIIQCIKTLQKLHGVSISLQSNNLEQSFIAIDSIDANEMEESGTSITQNGNINQSSNINNENPQVQVGNISQICGVMLKNLYCYIGKFHYFYNLNLIILVCVTAINSLLLSKLADVIPKEQEQEIKKQNKSNTLFIISGYVLMSSAFLSVPVLEKEEKIILLMRTRGLKKINYWIGHFIFDFVYFCINFTLVYIWFASQLKNIPVWVTLVTACAMIIYSYTASMIFNKVKTANSWFTIINTLLWLSMMPLMVPDSLISGTFYANLKPLKYLFPYFDLSAYLMRSQEMMPGMNAIIGALPSQQQFTVHICFIVYLVIFVLLQTNIIQKLIKRQEDENCLEQIKLENVSKKYKDTQALRNVSYSLNNQRLALLGHNGAGKSTTFALLSSQLNPTQGKVFLQKKVKKKYNNVMNSAGICYQEDTLWKFMTPRKILKIFSLLVGTKSEEKETEELFDNLDIERQLKNRKFENLSGGNKRKICMAVCLLGSPSIKLLDECSTGLDPVSKQSMVNTLKNQSRSTIVLTTHSMPQAERVCSRAIIMKKGEVSKDNKIFKLKQEYYHCYWIQLIIDPSQNFDYVIYQIFSQNKSVQYKIITKNRKKQIEIEKSSIKLSQLMQLLHKSKGQYIQDFNINQPKLQDVYLIVTADQPIQYVGGQIPLQQFNQSS